ncbi:MAG: hypothetical protein CMI95_05745 [Pelagibacteraceae bacterium]|nr:hypothetical protein [Pelagibacteraceae bacterium]|tara:strand:- start:22748 stop:24085 length:1338 start_codon:yes stop_codon:yes gene_type:complete
MDKDIINMVSINGKKKITCFRFMEECFQNEGYISSEKLRINFLNKLLNPAILRKIKTFFSLYLKCKFIFKDPKNLEFAIFDSENSEFIKKILPNKNYVTISTRIEKINEIYFSKRIIVYFFRNILKGSLKQIYLAALINAINPRIVITHISDSLDFHVVGRILNDKIKFIAVQTYSPNAFNKMFPGKREKKFFIPTFFCFSKYDELFYKKKKATIGSFEIVGSLPSSLTHEYVQSQKLKINPNKHDICLIAEPFADIGSSDFPHVKNLPDSMGIVAEFTYKLCKKHDLNIIFSGKGPQDTIGARTAMHFYKYYLKKYNFEIFHSSKEMAAYSSYLNIMQSRLTIGCISTMLREAISLEKKFLSFNTVGHPDVSFSGPGIKFPQESICVLTKPSYEFFEERVLKILSMTNEEYFAQLGVEKSFLMFPGNEAANILRKRLKEISGTI